MILSLEESVAQEAKHKFNTYFKEWLANLSFQNIRQFPINHDTSLIYGSKTAFLIYGMPSWPFHLSEFCSLLLSGSLAAYLIHWSLAAPFILSDFVIFSFMEVLHAHPFI